MKLTNVKAHFERYGYTFDKANKGYIGAGRLFSTLAQANRWLNQRENPDDDCDSGDNWDYPGSPYGCSDDGTYDVDPED